MKRLPTVYHLVLPLAVAMLAPGGLRVAYGQGQEMPPIKVDLPPPPNFNVQTAPEKYPSGEMSIYGLRKHMSQYLDKDVQVKAYLLQIYECPAEQRKCNDDLAAKSKKEKKKELANAEEGQGDGRGAREGRRAAEDGGRLPPCDQPHFFLGDTPTTKLDHGLLVADYPIKDWNTGKPKPLVAKAGEQYIVTGTFAINSIGGFAASDGLIIHKKFRSGRQGDRRGQRGAAARRAGHQARRQAGREGRRQAHRRRKRAAARSSCARSAGRRDFDLQSSVGLLQQVEAERIARRRSGLKVASASQARHAAAVLPRPELHGVASGVRLAGRLNVDLQPRLRVTPARRRATNSSARRSPARRPRAPRSRRRRRPARRRRQTVPSSVVSHAAIVLPAALKAAHVEARERQHGALAEAQRIGREQRVDVGRR